VDAILIALPYDDPGVATQALYDEPFMVAVPKAIRGKGASASPRTSSRARACCCSGEGIASAIRCWEICHSVKTRERGTLARTMEGGSLETIRQMVAGGRRDGAAGDLDRRRRRQLRADRILPFARRSPSGASDWHGEKLPAPRGDRGAAQLDPRLQPASVEKLS